MGFINLKTIVYAVVFIALLVGLWWVQKRIARSYDADRLQLEVALKDVQIERDRQDRKQAEQDALRVTIAVSDSLGKLRNDTLEAIKRAKVIIKDTPDCNIGPDVIRLLNEAGRGHGLSPAAPGPDAGPTIIHPDTGTGP
jgi:hypothetical protein